MNPMLWTAGRWLKGLGWPGMVGVALLVLGVAAYLGVLLPQQARSEQLTQDVADEQARQKTSGSQPTLDTHSTEARLHAFYAFFPPQQDAPHLLKIIYGAAQAEGLGLAEGEYKFSRAKAGGIGMYQVDLPVKGSYIQIRKFIVKVLNSVPSAALDEVSFKREIVGSGELEAKVRFTLYLGAS